ncbi:type II toxin-antitoxin system VapC family toxin [Polaromonas sp.]|uniref:type II toxin-antitoxin system VapC family toxin n=1 Tax=Polaromonas sp. TaxID=1869339 RepID=UPI003BB7D138
MNVVDSSAWIEFFKAGPNGPIFKPVIEDHAHLLVPTISLFEVHRVLRRVLPAEIVETCLDAMRRGRVLDLTDRRAIAASEAATRHRLVLADAAIYSMALEHRATLWTQDVDYQGLPGVNYSAKP